MQYMDNKQKKLLKDILDCINHIEEYVEQTKTFDDYDNNSLIQDAVERNIITIGEAVNALLYINSNISISNSRRVVDARNKITHGYDEIENLQIWNIVVSHLPILKNEVENLLKS